MTKLVSPIAIAWGMGWLVGLEVGVEDVLGAAGEVGGAGNHADQGRSPGFDGCCWLGLEGGAELLGKGGIVLHQIEDEGL